MAKIACKGTVLQQTISAALVPVAQVRTIEFSGIETETTEVTSLDGGVGKEYMPTGYAEGGSVNAELFFDPALAGHQAITDRITTPAENDMKVIFADQGATEWPFTVAGTGIDINVDPANALMASVSFKLTGLPTFAT